MIDQSNELHELVVVSAPKLRSLPEPVASEKPLADKWSRKEILGHLIDSAANNHQRIVRMQETQDIGAFRYTQQHWASSQKYQSESWEELVRFWESYNFHLSHVIAHVDARSLENVCDMGYAKPATLRFVIEDYLRHLRHHLGQILENQDPRGRSQWVKREPV